MLGPEPLIVAIPPIAVAKVIPNTTALAKLFLTFRMKKSRNSRSRSCSSRCCCCWEVASRLVLWFLRALEHLVQSLAAAEEKEEEEEDPWGASSSSSSRSKCFSTPVAMGIIMMEAAALETHILTKAGATTKLNKTNLGSILSPPKNNRIRNAMRLWSWYFWIPKERIKVPSISDMVSFQYCRATASAFMILQKGNNANGNNAVMQSGTGSSTHHIAIHTTTPNILVAEAKTTTFLPVDPSSSPSPPPPPCFSSSTAIVTQVRINSIAKGPATTDQNPRFFLQTTWSWLQQNLDMSRTEFSSPGSLKLDVLPDLLLVVKLEEDVRRASRLLELEAICICVLSDCFWVQQSSSDPSSVWVQLRELRFFSLWASSSRLRLEFYEQTFATHPSLNKSHFPYPCQRWDSDSKELGACMHACRSSSRKEIIRMIHPRILKACEHV